MRPARFLTLFGARNDKDRCYHRRHIVHIATGTRFGPYEITGLLGAGGMGEVYRARDTRLPRDVAIKVLPASLSSDPRLRERFAREARVISSLSHPHICTLFDVGQENGVDYLVMELVQGRTLAEALANGPLPLGEVLRCGTEIADAMAKAHAQGVVHRDLKPGNIMLTKSGVKVLDFGLATDAVAGDPLGSTRLRMTEEGTVLGTMQYMAPEQLNGAPADARSDIFALGVILYEMAGGRHPFEANNRTKLIAAVLESDPPPLPQSVPPALDHVIRRCMAKDPDERLQSARDVAFALQDIGHPVAARKQRLPVMLIAAAAIVIAIAIAAWFVIRHRPATAGIAAPRTIAVLPFANLGVDRSREFLRLAIPDEITTILTYSPGLSVRPFSASRRLTGDLDPQEAAKKLDAAEIVSGHLMDDNGRLVVTLEAIDAANNKLRWRDVFEVQSSDLVTMRRELSDRIRNGLLPKLAPGGEFQERSEPRDGNAYALFLRASAMSTDPAPNREALQLLEGAVKLDPNYAPAWSAISSRAYFDYHYARGGRGRLAQAQESAARALQLDPDLATAAIRFIVMRTESGEAAEALRDARRLVARRPSSAEAHFAVSYPLRYGGSLREAAAECEAAYALDRNRGIRSCALVFLQLGEYERALAFTRLDAGTEWSARITARILASQGKTGEAVRVVPPGPDQDILTVVMTHAPPATVKTIIENFLDDRRGVGDGEPYFYFGGYVSAAGQPAAALGLLNTALESNYCSVPGVDNDPLYANVRRLPEFAAFHERAVQCRARFIARMHER